MTPGSSGLIPGLALSDFHIFPNSKKALDSQHFANNSDIRKARVVFSQTDPDVKALPYLLAGTMIQKRLLRKNVLLSCLKAKKCTVTSSYEHFLEATKKGVRRQVNACSFCFVCGLTFCAIHEYWITWMVCDGRPFDNECRKRERHRKNGGVKETVGRGKEVNILVKRGTDDGKELRTKKGWM